MLSSSEVSKVDDFSARAATGRLSSGDAEMVFLRGRGMIVGVDDQGSYTRTRLRGRQRWDPADVSVVDNADDSPAIESHRWSPPGW